MTEREAQIRAAHERYRADDEYAAKDGFLAVEYLLAEVDEARGYAERLRDSLSDMLGPTMDYSIAIQRGRPESTCAVSHSVAVLRRAWGALNDRAALANAPHSGEARAVEATTKGQDDASSH